MKKILLGLALCTSLTCYAQDEPIVTESTVKSDSVTTVKSPPPSAILPTMNNSNSDLCTVGVAGAVQTQILGISAGSTMRDMNCEKLKNAKTLYDMGMKVAAVSVMCQDQRVFDAMMMAGTPCPYNGLIGPEARIAWETAEKPIPEDLEPKKEMSDEVKTAVATGGITALLLLLLL